MLNKKLAHGIIGGTHEHGAAFEQHGRLFDINGYEIHKHSGQRLEGPDSPGWVPPQKAQQKAAPAPTAANLVDQLIALFGSREAALAALQAAAAVTPGPSTPAPTPAGLSLEGMKNPPEESTALELGAALREREEKFAAGEDPDAGTEPSGDEAEQPASSDIIEDGINLSAWARGLLPNVEFMKVKPIVKKVFGKTPVNAGQAITIINRGLPE